MKIIGVDPGYDRFGVSVVEKKDGKETLLFSDCVKTDKYADFSERLVVVGNAFEELVQTWNPDGVAVETLYITKNQKTAMRVSEARGVCMYIAGKHRLYVFEYTPIQIKETICGYGRADKKQVADMIQRTISLPPKKRLDDEYDAIAVAFTCLYRDINILSTQLKNGG